MKTKSLILNQLFLNNFSFFLKSVHVAGIWQQEPGTTLDER